MGSFTSHPIVYYCFRKYCTYDIFLNVNHILSKLKLLVCLLFVEQVFDKWFADLCQNSYITPVIARNFLFHTHGLSDSINHLLSSLNSIWIRCQEVNSLKKTFTSSGAQKDSMLCQDDNHQSQVNYYANSIYLSRDLPPLYLPNGELQYGGQYPDIRWTSSTPAISYKMWGTF